MKSKTAKPLLAVIIVATCFFVSFGITTAIIFACHWYVDNRKPNFEKDYVLYVYPDTPLSAVEDSLIHGAGVRNVKSLLRTFQKEGVDGRMKPGRYVLDTKVSSTYAARMLNLGWQTAQNLTFSGTIRTRERVVKIISSQMMVDSTTVADALTDNDFLSNYGVDSVDFFTIILPDTYQIYWTSSIDEIFARLRKEYDAFWTDERVEKARMQGLTQYQASIMASIVQGETRKPEEYPVIAGVYLNRLHKGMKLQADPTICYIYGYTLNRVLKKHLEAESPYNTYKYVGLPPTPINSPCKECLEAVLNPKKHNYIFFCASPAFDGTHRFAVTYDEHMKNAREFQTALTLRNRQRAAAAK